MVTINVNGKSYSVNVDPSTPLLWVLRDVLGFTGTKYGCGIEVCGACTVLVDGEPERSCDMDVTEASSHQITTIEGLSTDGSHPVQQAWLKAQVPQCGYCQSGMILRATALLRSNPNPTDGDIAEIDNICVCGTYSRIREAIHLAAGNLSTGGTATTGGSTGTGSTGTTGTGSSSGSGSSTGTGSKSGGKTSTTHIDD